MLRVSRLLLFTLVAVTAFGGSALADDSSNAAPAQKSTTTVNWRFTGPTFTASAAGQPRQWTLANDTPQERLVRIGADGTSLTYYGARAKSDKGEVVFVTCDHQALPIQKNDAIRTTNVSCGKVILTGDAFINSQFAAGAIGTAKITKSALSKSAIAATSYSCCG